MQRKSTRFLTFLSIALVGLAVALPACGKKKAEKKKNEACKEALSDAKDAWNDAAKAWEKSQKTWADPQIVVKVQKALKKAIKPPKPGEKADPTKLTKQMKALNDYLTFKKTNSGNVLKATQAAAATGKSGDAKKFFKAAGRAFSLARADKSGTRDRKDAWFEDPNVVKAYETQNKALNASTTANNATKKMDGACRK